ncbi:MAG TPA: nuclear transport factor 2 family protein, partial [Algoriphagus sp.]|nr:nuclear transport factor 2 family protein [Algoriphagus sp.]
MKLNLPSDCGNSPKKKLIAELTALFAEYAITQAMEFMAEDMVWTLVGDHPIYGKENFAAALQEMSHTKATELTIHQIITHGKEAAVSGEMVMDDGKTYGFSDFYT